MNERIKELAEQAETKEMGYYFFDREKFAELIIKECASHLNSIGDDYAGIELLEHFGMIE